jgi:large repetitive protein
MHGRPFWRALKSDPRRMIARLSPGPGRVVAAVLAVVMAVALCAAVVAVHSSQGGGPTQRVWGSAAGRPHRVPAAATMVTLVNGHVVRMARAPRAGAAAALPAPKRPPGAVAAARQPGRLRLPVSGKSADGLHAVAQPKAAVKKGFDPATSRELPAASNANRIVYANADGTKTALLFQSPVNWLRPGGSWTPIDTSLVPADGGTAGAALAGQPAPTLAPTPAPTAAPPLTGPSAPDAALPTAGSRSAASLTPPVGSPSGSTSATAPPSPPAGWVQRSAAEPVAFAPYADAGTLVRLPLDGSHAVGFAVAGVVHTAGAVKESSVTYAGTRADSDLRFLAGVGFAKEQLILRSPAAPTSWLFPLRLVGLRAAAGVGGAIEFTDAAGKVRAVIPHGFMTDSNIDPHSGNGVYSSGVSYSLTSLNGQPAVRMTLDISWLHAAARVFPVTVDPSVSAFNSGGTTYVMSPFTNDYSSDTQIDVGTYDGGSNVAKSFLKFDAVSSQLANNNVLGARLSVFNSWSYSCSPRTVYVYPVTSSWAVSGNKSWPGPATGAAVARLSFATGWVPQGSATSPCPSRWEGFDLGQAGNNLLNGWTHGTIANNGLALGASGSDSYGWKKFTSINNPTGDPFLAVTYTPYGARYKLASTKPVTQITPTQNGKIAIKVTNTGASTWTPTNGYELSYRAYNAKGQKVADHPVFTPMPASVAPGGSVTVDAVVDKLPVGNYAIDFDMYAGATGSSPISFSSQGIAPFAVGLAVAQPPPVINSVYPPTGYISPTVTPELSTSASSSGTITYQFTITCEPLPGTTCPASVINSGKLSKPYWTVSPPMDWNQPYAWTVTATVNGASTTVGPVTITPEVPQPDITSRLGGSSGQAFDPQTGDYTTPSTDAAVAAAGPPLAIDRSYNSLDPRLSGAFGAGWSTATDMAVTPDGDGSGNVVVTLSDGRQARFGCDWTGSACTSTYAPPMGSADVLAHNADGTWSLLLSGGTRRRRRRRRLALRGAHLLRNVPVAVSGRRLGRQPVWSDRPREHDQ